MEADEVLKDHRNTAAQLCGVDAIDVNAIPGDGAGSRPIEPCQEFRECGLTGTVFADQRHDFARTNAERDIAKRGFGSRWVGETDAVR